MTDLGQAFREAVKTDVPTLFLSGTIDGRTSITDAEGVRRGLSRSAHVVVDGAGHNFYTRAPGVLETMKAFHANGTLQSRHLSAPFIIRPPQ